MLEADQRARFLAHAKGRRPLFEFLAHTGLRIGEALGLTWADIDYEQAVIRVHRQLSRDRELPSAQATLEPPHRRSRPTLVRQLREHWLATPHRAPTDYVFANTLGRGINYRDVGEDFRATLRRADIAAPGRLTLHSFRHGYASLLISAGLNVVYVSRQLGHANPAITLELTPTSTPKPTTPQPRAQPSTPATH